MANVNKSDLMELYYAKELPIKDIASRFSCGENNINYHQKQMSLKRRDRALEGADEIELAKAFAGIASGIDFERDVENIALATMLGASIVRQKIQSVWEEKYSEKAERFAAEQFEEYEEDEGLDEEGYSAVKLAQVPDKLKVQIYRIDKSIPLPVYSTPGSVAVDLYSRVHADIRPGQYGRIPCNIIVKVPDGYGCFILPRSGLASKQGVTVLNTPGLIDRDYNGPEDEICAILINHSFAGNVKSLSIDKGHKVAQMVIIPVPTIEWEELDAAPGEVSRDGFGSTGI